MRYGRMVLGLALLVAPLSTARAQTSSSIARAAWMAGCWESRSGTRVVEEIWMAPAAGLMLGGGRTVAGGVLRTFEHLRIQAVGDTLVYTAIPYRQQQTEFKGVPGDGVLTFENLAHDFPQRIIYRRNSADSITARVEGPGANGAAKGFDVAMKRVTCS